jgi:hypothetical protein
LGGALVLIGMALQDSRLRRSVPAPLSFVGPANSSASGVTAQIPPITTTYEPIYLSDAQLARLERGKGSEPIPLVAHEPIEASRR